MKKRILALLFTGVLVAALLAGCGGSSPSSSAASSAKSPEAEAPAPAAEASAPAAEAPAPAAEASAPAAEASSAAPAAAEAAAEIDLAELDADASNIEPGVPLEERMNHEVYTYFDDLAFKGVPLPKIEDRSGIEKNLPVEQKSDVVVGYVCPTQGSSYVVGCRLGAERQCEKYGYELHFMDAGNMDPVDQSSDIEALVTMGVDVLIVDPADTQANLKDVMRAVEAGIPVVATGVPFDADAPVITTVVNSNYYCGWVTGAYAAKLYPADQIVNAVMIPGATGHPVSEAESNGFYGGWVWQRMKDAGVDALKEDAMLIGYKAHCDLLRGSGKADLSEYGLICNGSVDGAFIEADGMTAAEDLLTANPDTDLIFAHNDHMGGGAAKVVEQRGLQDQIKIVCVSDGDGHVLRKIEEGSWPLVCTGYNSGLALGKNCVELIHKIFEEGFDANNLPLGTYLPITVIDKTNAAEFINPDDEDYAIDLWLEFKTVDEVNAENGY